MKRLALSLIAFYRKAISPAKPPCCRFYPTCSAYAEQAVKEWGLLRGGALAVRRLCRCNPLFKGGYDPVPERGKKEKKRKKDRVKR